MRTTVDLADDVAAAVARLRRERGLGMSEAVNELVRIGIAAPSSRNAYVPQGAALGIRMDVTDIAAVLEVLDESDG